MAEVTIRMGGYQGDASVHTRAARMFGEGLAALSGGRAELALTENVTALGRPATDLFAMVEGGALDLCYFASSYLTRRVPDLEAFDLPFAVADRAGIHARLDAGLARMLGDRIAAATPFALVAAWDNGFRHFTNAVRPLVVPADCAGLKVRTMDSRIHQESFAALGFAPVYIDVKDYPEAVRSGRVEAQENPLTNTVNFGCHLVHPYLTLTGHFFGLTLVLANRVRMAAWPAPVRAAAAEAMARATAAQRAAAVAEDARCRAVIEAAGVAIVEAAGFDRAAFVAAVGPVVAAAAARIDPAVLARVRG